ncbi:hypothetical protein BH24CHL4_BH24CHL4_18590 [soil metagenome]
MLARLLVAITITLSVFLAGGIASGFAPTGAYYQDADPVGSPEALPSVLLAWLDGFSVRDPEAFAALYTEDGVFEDVAAGIVATGHEEIAAAMAGTFALIAESDAQAVGGFQSGNQVVMEYSVTAVSAAAGQTYSFRGVVIAELEGDLLKRTTEYYDLATILGQLGLLGGPAVAETGTPTP